jgi:hypothetical protein
MRRQSPGAALPTFADPTEMVGCSRPGPHDAAPQEAQPMRMVNSW